MGAEEVRSKIAKEIVSDELWAVIKRFFRHLSQNRKAGDRPSLTGRC